MRFFTISILSALAALASATVSPDYSNDPSGNPILLPGLNDQVPVGEPYKIEWTPTTEGNITLWLLRGPSTNVKQIATLATNIPNSGEYTWTPSTSLENDVTHYGLMIIVDATGQYQYSTQFGIENDALAASSSAAVASSTVAITATSSASSAIVIATTPSTEAAVQTTSIAAVTSAAVPAVPSVSIISVSVPTQIATSTPATPTTLTSTVSTTSPTSSPSPSTYTGAADRKTAGFGAVAVAAGLMAVFA